MLLFQVITAHTEALDAKHVEMTAAHNVALGEYSERARASQDRLEEEREHLEASLDELRCRLNNVKHARVNAVMVRWQRREVTTTNNLRIPIKNSLTPIVLKN